MKMFNRASAGHATDHVRAVSLGTRVAMMVRVRRRRGPRMRANIASGRVGRIPRRRIK